MSVNKVILVGNVGADPEMKHLENNVPMARFSLATSESYLAKNGERVTTTEWHNIVLWRGLAEMAEKYIKKGKQLYIEGRIRTRSWDDKDGQKKYFTEIVGDVVRLLGSREVQSSDSTSETQYPKETSASNQVESPDFGDQPDDDLPF